MKTPSYPSRRRILVSAGFAGVAGAAGAVVSRFSRAAGPPARKVILGSGKHKYQWVSGWGTLPAGMSFGNTHGCIVTDSKRRIFMNTDSDNAVIVFDGNGKFIKSWGAL